MKIGKPLFKGMAGMKDGSKPDYISSDCPLGGHHIAQGFEVNILAPPSCSTLEPDGQGLWFEVKNG